MFDLNEFAQQSLDSAILTLTHPATGEAMNIKITLASPDSEAYRKVSMRVQNAQLKYALQNRGKTTAERLAANGLDVLVGATLDWEGIAENGVPLPCTLENVRRVYTDFPFIREQVEEFLGDRQNFFRK